MSDTSLCRCTHPESEHRGGVGICMVHRKSADGVNVPCNCFHFLPKVLKGEEEKKDKEQLH